MPLPRSETPQSVIINSLILNTNPLIIIIIIFWRPWWDTEPRADGRWQLQQVAHDPRHPSRECLFVWLRSGGGDRAARAAATAAGAGTRIIRGSSLLPFLVPPRHTCSHRPHSYSSTTNNDEINQITPGSFTNLLSRRPRVGDALLFLIFLPSFPPTTNATQLRERWTRAAHADTKQFNSVAGSRSVRLLVQ